MNLLSGLAVRLTAESAGGLLDDTLGLLLMGLSAPAGVALQAEATPRVVAERGFQAPSLAREVLAQIATQALSTRRPIVMNDVRAHAAELAHVGELATLGFQALIAVPVLHRRERLAALIVLFPHSVAVDEEGVDFARAVTNVLALAMVGEARSLAVASQSPPQEELLLASTIAHELRGPVGALALQLEEQERLVSEIEAVAGPSDTALGASISELEELTRDVQAVVGRLRQLVTQLGQAGATPSPLELLDLSEVVREALAERRPHLERLGIGCEVQLGDDCEVVGRRADVRRATLALLEYAASRAGELGRRVSVSCTATEGGVALRIGSSGKPLSALEQRSLTAGHLGSDLRLRIVQDILREHGGHLELHRTASYSVVLTMLLPAAERGSGVFAVPESATPSASRRAQVLLVDDDDVFARTMRRALKPHHVHTASSASEAEITLIDRGFLPDLVLCDVHLPGSNGDELHARVERLRPELAARFVFITGGALSPEQAEYIRRSGRVTLHKPLDLDQVRKMLSELSPSGINSERTPSVRTLSGAPSQRTPSQRSPSQRSPSSVGRRDS
ncbi:MAG: hybrid sensor histidine kinase/response regulator [Polyangiaceae bacterium]|nr:hybrid sensor histidine kinase/response regulator [Polyangiaceae bacterium]MCW5791011.1 hybrid sensor histidine kinase/response regulator [Polyangiaceae bacterium]